MHISKHRWGRINPKTTHADDTLFPFCWWFGRPAQVHRSRSPVKGGVSRRRLRDDLHQSGLASRHEALPFEVTEPLKPQNFINKSHWTAPKRSHRTDTWFRKSPFSHPYLAWWSPNTYVFARNHQPHDRTTNSWECTKSPSANPGDPAHSLVLIFAASEKLQETVDWPFMFDGIYRKWLEVTCKCSLKAIPVPQ